MAAQRRRLRAWAVAICVLCQAPRGSTGMRLGAGPRFDLTTACLLASKSFQAYVDPPVGIPYRSLPPAEAAAFAKKPVGDSPLSAASSLPGTTLHRVDFVRDAFGARLAIELQSIKGLRPDEDMGQKVLTGGNRDLYIVAWLAPRRAGAVAEHRFPPGLDRSTTRWRLKARSERDEVSLYNETLSILIPKGQSPSDLDLNMLLVDAQVAKEDEVLGKTTLPLYKLVSETEGPDPSAPQADARPDAAEAAGGLAALLRLPRRSSFAGDLSFKVPAPFGPGAVGGALLGAAVGGPVGAAAGAAAASYLRTLRADARLKVRVALLPAESAALADAPPTATEGDAAKPADGYRFGDVTRALLGRPRTAAPDPDADPGAGRGSLAGAAAEEAPTACGDFAAKHMLNGTLEDWGSVCALSTGGSFELIASVDEESTDTQCMVWRSAALNAVVVAFRGTEQTRWRDLLTDATLVQESWSEDHKDWMAHAGFKRAYDSVKHAVRGAVAAAAAPAAAADGPPLLLVTGHSLGGALATLSALDLFECGAAKGFSGVELYTFGAPRVGNRRLCEAINARLPGAFRVVNGQDVVARLPRGAGGAALGEWKTTLYGALDYAHCGTPVLVDERESVCRVGDGALAGANDAVPAAAGGGGGGVLGLPQIEVLESDPFRDPLGEGSLLKELYEEVGQALAGGEEEAMDLERGLARLDGARARLLKRLEGGLKPAEISSVVGLRGEFLEAEMDLLRSFTSGEALRHHLEPSYFVALSKAKGGAA